MSKQWALATLPLAILLAACSSQPAATPSEHAATSAAPSAEASAMADGGSGSEVAKADHGDHKGFPVTIENCGVSITYEKAPEKAITMNQGATEVMLALGLEDHMVGTAYLDDPKIGDKFKAAYDKVPVLAEKYPTLEQFLAAEPDFAYASYPSAFEAKNTKDREELKADGINTYVSDFGCKDHEGQPASWERVYNQITDIAKIFGHADHADKIINEQKKIVDDIAAKKAAKGAKAVWWDSGVKESPFVAGGTGGPQLIMDAVGFENAFKSTADNWFDSTWEEFVAADPDWIILADASWDEAKGKIEHAKNDPVLKELRAVKEDKFLTLPFSQTTPGVTLVDGLESLDKQLNESK